MDKLYINNCIIDNITSISEDGNSLKIRCTKQIILLIQNYEEIIIIKYNKQLYNTYLTEINIESGRYYEYVFNIKRRDKNV